MSFFGCVFNEYIILYFCGLERETQDEIAYRAYHSRTMSESELDEITKNEKDDEDENDVDDNDEIVPTIKMSNTVVSLGDYDLNLWKKK